MAYDQLPSFDPMAKQGRIFCASIGSMAVGTTLSGALTTTIGRARLVLSNPAGSGRLIHMMGLTLNNATAASVSVVVHHNPTTGLPTATPAITQKNLYLMPAGDTSLAAAKGVVTADTASNTNLTTLMLANAALPVMGGSTGQLPPLAVPTNFRVVSNLTPILIAQGASLGWDLTTNNTNGVVVLGIYWWEEDKP